MGRYLSFRGRRYESYRLYSTNKRNTFSCDPEIVKNKPPLCNMIFYWKLKRPELEILLDIWRRTWYLYAQNNYCSHPMGVSVSWSRHARGWRIRLVYFTEFVSYIPPADTYMYLRSWCTGATLLYCCCYYYPIVPQSRKVETIPSNCPLYRCYTVYRFYLEPFWCERERTEHYLRVKWGNL